MDNPTTGLLFCTLKKTIMKKILILLLCTFTFMYMPLPAQAQSQHDYINEGYTTDGMYYTVYEIETLNTTRAVGDTVEVTRQFVYGGIYQPPLTQVYTEKVGAITYTGTLKLAYFYHENGHTYGVYRGTLTAIN